MKQAFVTKPGEIHYRDVERPVAEPNSVVIKVSRIGICGSDIHVFLGKHPLVSFPLVQGHEFSGYIEEIGEENDKEIGNSTKNLEVGDLVTVFPAIGCGNCSRCQVGLVAQCEELQFIGGALEGAGSEYIMVDEKHVIKIPHGIDADDAAMVEPLAVAVHSVRKASQVKGKNVLIMGGGTIGNLIAQAARLFSPKKIVVMEKILFRREVLETLGFDTLKAQVDMSVGAIADAFVGRDIDLALECVGSQRATNLCIEAVGRGGEIIIVGVYESPPQVEMIMVQDKELTLKGSLMYTMDDYYQAISLMKEKKVNLKILQTHHVPFHRWIEGYRLLMEDSANVLKVFIDF